MTRLSCKTLARWHGKLCYYSMYFSYGRGRRVTQNFYEIIFLGELHNFVTASGRGATSARPCPRRIMTLTRSCISIDRKMIGLARALALASVAPRPQRERGRSVLTVKIGPEGQFGRAV